MKAVWVFWQVLSQVPGPGDIDGEHSHTGWHPRVKEKVSVVWGMHTACSSLPFNPG